MKILFVDIDGTLTETISGHAFKQSPTDVKIIEGADKAIAHFSELGWLIVGISNQGGIAAGHKSLKETCEELQFTLDLFPKLETIYFCPDFEGNTLYQVCDKEYIRIDEGSEYAKLLKGQYRKPLPGIIKFVFRALYPHVIEDVWMIGDRPQDDQQCAINAGINFCPADVWRDKFRPGVFAHKVTPAQLEFLEGVRFWADERPCVERSRNKQTFEKS